MRHSRKVFSKHLTRVLRLNITDIRGGCIGGMVLLMLAIITRLLSGSPYRIYILLRQFKILPPLVLLSTVNLLLTVAMGFACGLILSQRRCGKIGEEKYRSGMLFVILITLWLATYPMMFRSCMLGVTLLFLTAACVLSAICTLLFSRIRLLSASIALVFSCWIGYLIILLVDCILRI